jgi:hypothetical protein
LSVGRISIFLSVVLGVAAICTSQIKNPAPRKTVSQTGFGVAEAMKMFYGNYDEKTQSSTMPSSGNDDFGALKDDTKQIAFGPLFHAFTEEDGIPSFMLITYGLPVDKPYDCHLCPPVIGMAVFSRMSNHWVMTASNQELAEVGSFGKPETHIQLVRIGPRRHGVAITNHESGNGEYSASLLILTPFEDKVTVALDRAVANNDSGDCGKDSPWPCYSNKRIVTFLRDGDAEFYRLKLRLTGTDYVVSESRPESHPIFTRRQVQGLEILRLENGKYVQILRKGDLTNADGNPADISHLN